MTEPHFDNPQLSAKFAAAKHACTLVEAGMILGLGSGSTVEIFVEMLAVQKLSLACVATSDRIAAIAQKHGLQIADPLSWHKIDLTIDGADEIDTNLNLIKGLGGSLVREKIVAAFSSRFVIIADESKSVPQLGTTQPVPVEVSVLGREAARYRLAELVGDVDDVRLRADAAGKNFLSDNGNYIYDCFFGRIAVPQKLASQLDALPFVVGHGLFLGMTEKAIIGYANGDVKQQER